MILSRNNKDDLQNQIARLNQQATQLYEHGQYKGAIDIITQLCRILKQNFGENHPDYANSLNFLATLYYYIGDYSKAEPLSQQALEIRRQVLGENHPDYAISLNHRAHLYQTMGDYIKAEPLYQKAIEIQRQVLGENHLDYAASLNNLATLYSDTGDYSKAEQLYQNALEVVRQVLGENHPDYATCLNSLALLYYYIGDYSKAEQLYQQALEIRRQVLGENHPDYANSLNYLAELYQAMGDYSKAEPLYQNALEIRRQVLGENHPDYANSLDGLALLYYYIGDYSKAEPLSQQALEIRRQVLGENHPNYASGLHNLAVLYHSMGDYSKAEPLYKQTIEIQRQVLGENHPNYATSLKNLAALYIAIGWHLAEAMKLMKKAATVYDQMIGQIFSIASERQRMAFLKYIGSHLHMYLSLVLEYFDFYSSTETINSTLDLVLLRKAIGAEALAAQREAALSGKYPDLEPKLRELKTLRMQIAKTTLDGPIHRESLVEHQRYLEELNTHREQVEQYLAYSIPEIRLEQKLQTANRYAIANVLCKDDALVEFIRFNVADFIAVPAYGESMWKPAHYVAFILLGREPDNVQMIDLGAARSIDMMITEFINSITYEARHSLPIPNDPRLDTIYKGSILREILFDPLKSSLADKKRILIAPDGELNRLPFQILPKEDDGYLLDKYHISYLNTGRDILRFGLSADKSSNTPLVAVDPDFDFSDIGDTLKATEELPTEREEFRQSSDLIRSQIHFDNLPKTLIEGKIISDMLNAYLWTKDKILESRIKAYNSPLILHLATHGFFLSDQPYDLNDDKINMGIINPMSGATINLDTRRKLDNPLLRSGLAAAGANTWAQGGKLPKEAEDGLLTAEDVTAMDLTNTELVVLSACDTGLGDVLVGEGVFGLRRSFVLAGAKTLVMSLWKVSDEQTQELMILFYEFLLEERKTRPEALHSAQIAIKERYPNPYYWGAFICQGDPGSLSDQVIRQIKNVEV